jgi:hypothetical protein
MDENIQRSKPMSRANAKKLIEDIYVGYNPAATLDTAIGTAGKRFNDKLKTNFSHGELIKMMSGYNVINCGGLENYLLTMYEKMKASAK